MPLRLISYSLYRSAKRDPAHYVEGALANARLARELFPGWVSRVYLSADLAEARLTLEALDAEVVLRSPSHDQEGAYWRYEPAVTGDLDAVLFRDADCRLSRREQRLVERWLASGERYHVIRDSPDHKQPLMGGLWGCRAPAPAVRQLLAEQLARVAGQSLPTGHEEAFFAEHLYPLVRGELCVHDSATHPELFLDEGPGFHVGKRFGPE